MPYDLPSFDVHTRIITGPDGQDYLIAMEGWYWNSLDWLHAHTDWKDSDFIGVAWRAARRTEREGTMHHTGNFVAEMTLAFKIAIKTHMDDVIAAEDAQRAQA